MAVTTVGTNPDAVIGGVDAHAAVHVAALRQGGRLETGEVDELLGVMRPTAIGRLRRIEKLGVIRWIGKSDTDPSVFLTLAE